MKKIIKTTLYLQQAKTKQNKKKFKKKKQYKKKAKSKKKTHYHASLRNRQYTMIKLNKTIRINIHSEEKLEIVASPWKVKLKVEVSTLGPGVELAQHAGGSRRFHGSRSKVNSIIGGLGFLL